MEKAIEVKGLTKKYKLYKNNKERFLDLVTPNSVGEDFYALKGVDFEANKGEVIGFIGINGSGKSTLSNIISGIVPETSGTVKTNGEVSIIAVSAGLKNDLSGRDNIELKLIMLGFNKKEIEKLEADIIKFSELEKFIDQPVKSYSSGMRSRLGFAISVNVDPDIMIIDEALSVGDRTFADKSFDKMMEFKEQGKTMIFVSHSIGQMKQFCEKILWLEFGKVKAYGNAEEILSQYENFLNVWKTMSKKEREDYKKGELSLDLFNTQEQNYSEEVISSICHINSNDATIYKDVSKEEILSDSLEYTYNSYYIRKKCKYKNEEYLLLSTEPSYLRGVIGWINRKNLSLKNDLLIDNDEKEIEISKDTIFYNRPWGGRENIEHSFVSSKNDVIVSETRKIGGEIWFKIKGNLVWFKNKTLTSKLI